MKIIEKYLFIMLLISVLCIACLDRKIIIKNSDKLV